MMETEGSPARRPAVSSMLDVIKQRRVEIITFAVAITLSTGLLIWNESRKPRGGLLQHFRPEIAIVHKATGEPLIWGDSYKDAVQRHLVRRFGRWSPDSPGGPRQRRATITPSEPPDRLEGADLRGINFRGCDYRRLQLRNAACEGALFRDAQLNDAQLNNTDFTGADFDGAKMARADLGGARFDRARMTRVDFTGADLRGASLAHADCRGADFAGVHFDANTDFSGAILTGARNLPPQLRDQAARAGASF
jgi:hypothetical protein